MKTDPCLYFFEYSPDVFKKKTRVLEIFNTSRTYFIKINIVHMVLNPNGIEPTFLKLDSWSPGAGFIPINKCNKLDKGKNN